jgi:hypothetical protein
MIFRVMSFPLSPSTCHSILDTRPCSLDNRVRPHQHPLRDRQADLLGGFQICHEVELCRLFYRQVNGLGSLEKIKAFDRTV